MPPGRSKILIGCGDSKTGTGGPCAPLSEILPAARVARSVRMTEIARVLASLRRDRRDPDRDRPPNPVQLSPHTQEALVDSRRRSDRFAINIDNRSLRNFDAAVAQFYLEASPAYTCAAEDAYELLAERDRFDPVPRRVDHQQRLCDGSARDR